MREQLVLVEIDRTAADMTAIVRAAGLEALRDVADFGADGVTLRPSKIGADGFFVCALQRA